MFNFTLEDVEKNLSPDAAKELLQKAVTLEKHEFFINKANVSPQTYELAVLFERLPVERKMKILFQAQIEALKDQLEQTRKNQKLTFLNRSNKTQGIKRG